MSYKRWNDVVRGRAMIPFLECALSIQGVLVVAIVNKKIQGLGFSAGMVSGWAEGLGLKGKWKSKELITGIRVTHLLACLMAGLVRKDQEMYWISDQDNLLANPSKSADIARILGSFTQYYMPEHAAARGVGTTQLDEGDRWEEDLCAIADLSAGGLAEIANLLSNAGDGRMLSFPIQLSDVSRRADLIADWFWQAPGELRRVAIVYEPDQQGYRAFKLDMPEPDRGR